MEANEFVKKFGWDVAKVKTMSIYKDNPFQEELRRLVESWELVESRGGLDAAKHELILLQKHLNNTFGYVAIITSEKIENLQKAIADVESCM